MRGGFVFAPPFSRRARLHRAVFGGRYAPLVYDTTTGAEADVRVRERGRIVSDHRKR